MSVVVFVWCMVEHFDECCHVVEVFEVWMRGAYPALTQKLHHPGVGQRVEITAQQKLEKNQSTHVNTKNKNYDDTMNTKLSQLKTWHGHGTVCFLDG